MSVLGWVLLAVFVLLVLLLVMPASVDFEVKYDQPVARLKILFFSFRLWPRKEKRAKKEKKDKKPQHLRDSSKLEQEGQDRAAHQSSAQESTNADENREPRRKLSDLVRVITTATGVMHLVFKVIRVRDVKLVLPIHEEDAAQTAIQYGQVQAWLGGIFGTMQNFLDFQLKQVDIIPDFAGSFKYRRYFYCKIMATPFIILIAAIYAFRRMRAGRSI